MTLHPKRPPGRSTRKALAFASEIGRLHLDGYSCEAIRQALLDAGVEVSRSTVIREAARFSKSGGQLVESGRVTPAARPPDVQAPFAANHLPSTDCRSGKEIAAAWMKDRITNPLLRSRINDESSGH